MPRSLWKRLRIRSLTLRDGSRGKPGRSLGPRVAGWPAWFPVYPGVQPACGMEHAGGTGGYQSLLAPMCTLNSAGLWQARVPRHNAPLLQTSLPRELSLSPALPGAGSTAPQRERFVLATHWLRRPSVLRGEISGPHLAGCRGFPSLREINQRPRAPPCRTHTTGSFTPLYRRPLSHRPHRGCTLTPPGSRVFKLHLLSPTPASSRARARGCCRFSSEPAWPGSPRGQQKVPSPANERT